jgi:hypothetical protein
MDVRGWMRGFWSAGDAACIRILSGTARRCPKRLAAALLSTRFEPTRQDTFFLDKW